MREGDETLEMLLADATETEPRPRLRAGLLRAVAAIAGLSLAAGVAVTAAATPALLAASATSVQAMTFFDDLPHDLRVGRPMARSTLYATRPDGSPVELAAFFEQNRIPVAFDQVSGAVYDALVSSEDKDFAVHGGVNLLSTGKAIAENLLGTSSRGASTITQQFVKNVLIQHCEQRADATSKTYEKDLEACWLDATRASGDDGLTRKLQEMRYAIQIEKELTKKEILIGYLNLVNFGGGAYGIEAAARYYFSATAATLTLAQAATLVGMVQNPSLYRIDRPEGTREDRSGAQRNSAEDGYADTRKRRNYVLARMLEDGRISRAQYTEAKAAPVAPAIAPQTNGCRAAGANAYFCEYARTVLESDPAFGATQKERTERLRRGGLRIHTSLDLRLQEAAAQAMQGAADPRRTGAAAVSVEVGTGRILALAQNTTYTEIATEDPAATSLLFAADPAHGGTRGFPLGPSSALFAAVGWLEQGRPVSGFSADRPPAVGTCASTGATASPGAGDPHRTGAASGARAGSSSLTLDGCGVEQIAARLGARFTEEAAGDDAAEDGLASRKAAPLAMASAYATIANGGRACAPRAIDRVIDAAGEDLPLPDATCAEAIAPDVAADAVRALESEDGAAGIPLAGRAGSYRSWPALRVETSARVATATWAGTWCGAPADATAAQDRRDARRLRDLLADRLHRAAADAYGALPFPAG